MPLNLRTLGILFTALMLLVGTGNVQAEDSNLKSKAEQTLRKSLDAMKELRHGGGWAMAWSSDLKLTIGEHYVRPADTITIQPPATPGTAGVYLRAAQVLNDQDYLFVARQAGDALIACQLDCGGFIHDFTPGDSKAQSGSFDDDVTQGATRYLIDLWKATQDSRYADAAKRSCQFMLDSQYPNGGWPQAYPLQDGYSRYITINDRAMMDVMRTLFVAHAVFGDSRYYDAAIRGADCLLTLQGKPPQAGWAQQFTVDGQPAPARKFEPVALTSAESMGVLRVLLEVYLETGDKKYLAAGPPAFAWMKASRLPNGLWARFYEIGTNQDIYCTEDGEIVTDVTKARKGYGWQGKHLDEKLEEQFKALIEAPVEERHQVWEKLAPSQRPFDDKRVKSIIDALDENGYWLTPLPERLVSIYKERVGDPEGVQQIDTGRFRGSAYILLNYLESAE